MKAPMNLRNFVTLGGTLGALTLAACGKSGGPSDPTFSVKVAPLTLEGVKNACYRLTVTNGPDRTGDIVWQQDDVCADRYGDLKGSLSYVGTCDAGSGAHNSVTLELNDLMVGATPSPLDDGEYRNPCGRVADWSGDRTTLESGEDPYGPCTINKACVENADVPVTFNVTVMRDANQGFFDVAVEFDDIFCSAKLDCQPALLHDASGNRNQAAVVAFACTAGENEQTYMHISDLLLTCDGMEPLVIPASASTPGQHGALGGGVYEWAVYQGDEQLTSNGKPLEKCYWNRAIGLDPAVLAGKTCKLSGVATATSAALTPDMLTGEGVSYPIVTWSVDVLSGGSLCGANPLNVEGSGTQTAYVDASTDPAIIGAITGGATFACGAPEPVACAAGPISGTSRTDVTATLDNGTLTVTTGSSTTGPLALDGYKLAGCHRDACCSAGIPINNF